VGYYNMRPVEGAAAADGAAVAGAGGWLSGGIARWQMESRTVSFDDNADYYNYNKDYLLEERRTESEWPLLWRALEEAHGFVDDCLAHSSRLACPNRLSLSRRK
jgi:hypothetical protein